MNDDSYGGELHAWIELGIEARMVAMILGEASDFEVDELERLMEDCPELRIFKQRLEVVHGLLGEAVKPGDDADWRLSPQRRAEVMEAIGIGPEKEVQEDPVVVSLHNPRERRVRRAGLKVALMAAACLMISVLLASFFMTYSTKLASEARPMMNISMDADEDGRTITSYAAREMRESEALAAREMRHLQRSGGTDAELAKEGGRGQSRERSARPRNGREKSEAPADSQPEGADMDVKLAAPTDRTGTRSSGLSRGVDRPNLGETAPREATVHRSDDPAGPPAGPAGGPVAGRRFGTASEPPPAPGARPQADPAPAPVSALPSVMAKPTSSSASAPAEGKPATKAGVVAALMDVKDLNAPVDSGTYAWWESRYRGGRTVEDEETGDLTLGYIGGVATGTLRGYRSKTAGARDDDYFMSGAKNDGAMPRDEQRLDARNKKIVADKLRKILPKPKEEDSERPEEKKERQALREIEKSAAEEAFSTFSLHVSDVSFKLAQAALAKGEWPEAQRVRVEEFVNAFDYGDPAPTQDQKVSCQIEQAAHPFMQQRNLVRISMRTAAVGRASGTPLRLTVLLDNSGSMERADRVESVQRAFQLLAAQLNPQDAVTLISFARTPRLLRDNVPGDKAQELARVIAETPSEGGTNLEEALRLGVEKASERLLAGAQNRIILLTDGAANLGNARPEELAELVEEMRQKGIAFDACGVGAEGLNDDVLEALTRKGDGRYYFLDRPEDADAGFAKQIAGALRPAAKNVKVQVEFNPKRVGRYRLYGFEKHELKKEDFRNDSVDAAELAAEEAGVAIYQVEPLPDGEGHIGTVSVRFQDMSTGEMVEKLWTIPYVSNPARLEEAAPSMQLAASAAFLGEKLKGSPIGEAVELAELSGVSRALQTVYPSNQRVGHLVEMIEKARELTR